MNIDAIITKIERTFAQFPHERARMEDMGRVAKVGAHECADVRCSDSYSRPFRSTNRDLV